MKFFMIFASLFVLAACCAIQSRASALGHEDSSYVDGLTALKRLEPELHSRHKRATCDFLSGFGVKNSACALHCLLRGNRGGYCNGSAVCVCRN